MSCAVQKRLESYKKSLPINPFVLLQAAAFRRQTLFNEKRLRLKQNLVCWEYVVKKIKQTRNLERMNKMEKLQYKQAKANWNRHYNLMQRTSYAREHNLRIEDIYLNPSLANYQNLTDVRLPGYFEKKRLIKQKNMLFNEDENDANRLQTMVIIPAIHNKRSEIFMQHRHLYWKPRLQKDYSKTKFQQKLIYLNSVRDSILKKKRIKARLHNQHVKKIIELVKENTIKQSKNLYSKILVQNYYASKRRSANLNNYTNKIKSHLLIVKSKHLSWILNGKKEQSRALIETSEPWFINHKSIMDTMNEPLNQANIILNEQKYSLDIYFSQYNPQKRNKKSWNERLEKARSRRENMLAKRKTFSKVNFIRHIRAHSRRKLRFSQKIEKFRFKMFHNQNRRMIYLGERRIKALVHNRNVERKLRIFQTKNVQEAITNGFSFNNKGIETSNRIRRSKNEKMRLFALEKLKKRIHSV
eukprot:TRINITY_DN14422_c0_g1_i1.p1 TRINITY_DN14422_c0_g1~~TRINITY_DN14422_c0_g1_i1.p1  ORF type:complete len:470 (+),score=95.04 TRINITY_DN14422_c0_g1_i1:116-1525(+)